jgi:hypothetical protein
VKWENVDEIAKKVAQGGGKAWKRRIDEELLREVYAAQSDPISMSGTPEYIDAPVAAAQVLAEPPKKKQKTAATANGDSGTSTPNNEPAAKKKEKEKLPPVPKAPTPPPIPAPPRPKALPCAICRTIEGSRVECAACRLTVHKSCYGIDDPRQVNKWYCDTCKNDKKESVSYVSYIHPQLLTPTNCQRTMNVYSVPSPIRVMTFTNSQKSRTRRRPIETGRRSAWRRSSLTKRKRNTVRDSKIRADPFSLGSL